MSVYNGPKRIYAAHVDHALLSPVLLFKLKTTLTAEQGHLAEELASILDYPFSGSVKIILEIMLMLQF